MPRNDVSASISCRPLILARCLPRLPGAVEGLGGAFYAVLPRWLPTAIYGLGSILLPVRCHAFPGREAIVTLVAVRLPAGKSIPQRSLGPILAGTRNGVEQTM